MQQISDVFYFLLVLYLNKLSQFRLAQQKSTVRRDENEQEEARIILQSISRRKRLVSPSQAGLMRSIFNRVSLPTEHKLHLQKGRIEIPFYRDGGREENGMGAFSHPKIEGIIHARMTF